MPGGQGFHTMPTGEMMPGNQMPGGVGGNDNPNPDENMLRNYLEMMNPPAPMPTGDKGVGMGGIGGMGSPWPDDRKRRQRAVPSRSADDNWEPRI